MSHALDYIFLFTAFVSTYFLVILISGWMLKRAILQVMDIFQQHSASSRTSAKSIEQLGLQPPGLIERIVRVKRDYKPQALQFLIQQNVVEVTSDKRLYLTEEKRESFKRRMR